MFDKKVEEQIREKESLYQSLVTEKSKYDVAKRHLKAKSE